jgi:hypothetical protein
MRRTEAGGGGLAAITTVVTTKLLLGGIGDCITASLTRAAWQLAAHARTNAG